MSIIYLISNDINDKKYVGLTTRNLQIRWKEHLRQSSQEIDKAINKYGREHFTIIQLEECEDSILDEREKYWIKYYNSFENGYNMTSGGREDQAVFNFNNYNKVKELWDEGYGQKEIANIIKINIETVHNYLIKNGISVENIRERASKKISQIRSKPILQCDLEGNIIKEWTSTKEAVQAGYAKSTIQRSLYGKVNKPQKYIWRFKEKE